MDTTLFLTTIWLTSLSVAALASLSSLRVFGFFTNRRFIDCRIILSTNDSGSWELRKWRAIIVMAVQYVLPLSCISFLYVQVIKELRKCSLVRAMNQSSTSSNTSTLQHVRSVDHLLSRRFSNTPNVAQNVTHSIHNSIQNGTMNRAFADHELFRISLDEKPEINNNVNLENLNDLKLQTELRSLENLENLNESADGPTKFNLSDCLRRFSLANLPLFREKFRKSHSDDLTGVHEKRHGERAENHKGSAKSFSQAVRIDSNKQNDKPNDRLSDRSIEQRTDKIDKLKNGKLEGNVDGDQLARIVNKRLMNGRLMNKRSSSNESHSTFSSSQSYQSQSVSAKLNLLNSELDRTKRRLTTMMIIVVLVFACAWLPIHLFHIKQFLFDSYDFNYCDSSPLYLFFYFIAFSANTYNPIIYFYFSKELRRDALQMLKSIFGSILNIKKLMKGCNC